MDGVAQTRTLGGVVLAAAAAAGSATYKVNCLRFPQRAVFPQTTGERTGLVTGTSLYKKHVLKNWLVILSKTT